MKAEKSEEIETLMKLALYLISLWTLLFLLIVKTIDIDQIPEKISLQTIFLLWKYNSVSIICITLFLFGVVGFVGFCKKLDDSYFKNNPVKRIDLKKIKT